MSDYNLLINGKMVPGDLTMPVLNPATEDVLAQCPRASKNQLDAAVAAAKAAYPAWAATPIEERRKLVIKMADIIEANSGELARLLTSEQGKPLADATGEVLGMAAFFRYLGSLELPMRVIEDSGDRKVEAYRRPLGVVGAIIPWNYPLLILSFKLPSALLAGNTLVVKPAPTTPLSTLKFAELVKDVLPKGVLNVITDANDLGDAMTKHPDIRKISLTVSSSTTSIRRRSRPASSKARSRTPARSASPSSGSMCTSPSMTKSATSSWRSRRTPWSTTDRNRAPNSGRCRTRCSTKRSRSSSKTPARTAMSSPAVRRWTAPATSSSRPSCATSRKARGWSTRNSSGRCCR